MHDRSPAVLSPETWPFSLEWLPPEACLVGGAVRDALLGRQSEYLDLDFVVPENAVETARSLAKHYSVGFVVLDAQRQIARVVFPRATVDFALQEGETLEIDLHRRDFTVNAIAYNPHTGNLVDPLHGYEDLQQQQLRMVSRHNLEDDPLRLLRGYRQAAQLAFTLESHTRDAIRQLAPLLCRVAAERVYSEFGYLLSLERGTPWLEKAWDDGLLSVWFSKATAEDVERLQRIDRAVKILVDRQPKLAELLLSPIRSTLKTTGVSVAKLASLVSSDEGIAERELLRLKYSRLEVRSTVTLLQAWNAADSDRALREMSVRNRYFWFKAVGDVFPSYAVFAMASGIDFTSIEAYLDRFLTPNDSIAHPQPLVSGQDLIEKTHLSKGPQIGYWLTEIAVAHAEGKVSTAEEALQWVIGHG